MAHYKDYDYLWCLFPTNEPGAEQTFIQEIVYPNDLTTQDVFRTDVMIGYKNNKPTVLRHRTLPVTEAT
jgi:hypothetical protein